MTLNSPLIVAGDNLSVVWGRAFLNVYSAGEISPLVVQINGPNNDELPEIPRIRNSLDETMHEHAKGLSCHQVANTIFPSRLWNRDVDRQELYRRYLRISDRILRYPSNRKGVYFQRFISYGDGSREQGRVNQLEHIIQTWRGGNHRRSALQAAVFDPYTDHTHQPVRGFPCLQQVAFAAKKNSGLSVTGFYATQYIFERAYGNYLGLFRLGQFMAQEMKLRLERVICVASPAKLSGGRKRDLSGLAARVKVALEDYEDPEDMR